MQLACIALCSSWFPTHGGLGFFIPDIAAQKYQIEEADLKGRIGITVVK